jgi:hypothetical protein
MSELRRSTSTGAGRARWKRNRSTAMVLLAGHAAAEHGAQPATFAKPWTTRSVRFRKVEHFQGILRNMPRPGIEPGLEVPETSVMSFSLPGLSFADLINISGSGAGQARLRHLVVAQLLSNHRDVLGLYGRGNFRRPSKVERETYLKKARQQTHSGDQVR